MARTPDEIRAGRAASARRRRADPTKGAEIRARQKTWYHAGGAELQRAARQEIRKRQFFRWRATLWSRRYGVTITAVDLSRMWIDQRGRCALSGLKLDRSAQLDHVVPISRGGSHGLANLRWLDGHVNRARGDLTDAEFLALCESVARWIGERLAAIA